MPKMYQEGILERIDVNEKAEDTLMCIDAFHCQKGYSSISEQLLLIEGLHVGR